MIRCLARAFRVRDAAALAELALSIGSDVPFFLGPGPAWAAGRGERLRPAAVPPLHLVLLYPRIPALAIRAADAYRWLDEARRRPGRPARSAGRPARFRHPCGERPRAALRGAPPRLRPLLGLSPAPAHREA